VKDQAPKDWVIVGGGLIGSALALYIKSHVTEDFTLVDPYPKPIQQWETWARNCGMTHMRSTASHSLSWDFHGLWAYIKRQGRDPMAEFLPPNKRPSLEDFLRYSGFLCQEYHLLDHWLRGRVQGLLSHGGYWEVNLASGQTLHARRVLLALGGATKPRYPRGFPPTPQLPGGV
jgi:glycine/D-amino acid oxidase-like deaminating enzyme